MKPSVPSSICLLYQHHSRISVAVDADEAFEKKLTLLVRKASFQKYNI